MAARMSEISSRERPVGTGLVPPDHTPYALPVCGEPFPPDVHGGYPEVEPFPLLLVPQVSGKDLAHVAVARRRQIPVEPAQPGAEAPRVGKGVTIPVGIGKGDPTRLAAGDPA
jgi:hypothetical protein